MEKRYFTNWGYNSAKLLNHLKAVIENNGGYIVKKAGYPSYKNEYEIHNRTVIEEIHKTENMISDIEKWNNSESEKLNGLRQHRLQSLRSQLEKLKQDQPKPFTSRLTTYINFVHDGKYYYLTFDENPFFPFHYLKTGINEKGEVRPTYLDEFDKSDWMFDCLFESNVAEADYREIACTIFNKLVSAKETEPYYEESYERCPYCGSTHKVKKAPKKSNMEKVDI